MQPSQQQMQITPETANDLLRDLVAIPSPSYHEADAVQHLVSWMCVHGYDQAFVDEVGNAVGIRGAGSRTVVLLGHIDTFGGFPPVKIEDGKLYGRGSVDAKGSLATFAVAAAQATLPDDTRLVVIGAVEEECPTSAGAHHAIKTYQPDFCIIGEPSNWDRITLGYKGRLLLEWNWTGGLAHSASQETSAGEHAFAYWQTVVDYTKQFNEGKTRIFEKLDATLQDINTSQDGAYGSARMTVGFRLPPHLSPDEIVAALPPANDATVRPFGMEHAFVAEKDNSLTRAFRGAIRTEGGQPAFVHKTGTSDMNIAGRAWSCPIVAYGPGDSSLDHTPHEHIELTEFHKATTVLVTVLNKLKVE
jgi:LysW-gamma-L-lysine carboxypeptidase